MQFSLEISVTLSLPYLYEIMEAAFSFKSKRYIRFNRLENVHRKRERMISGACTMVYHPTCQEISCLVVSRGSFSVTKGGLRLSREFLTEQIIFESSFK